MQIIRISREFKSDGSELGKYFSDLQNEYFYGLTKEITECEQL